MPERSDRRRSHCRRRVPVGALSGRLLLAGCWLALAISLWAPAADEATAAPDPAPALREQGLQTPAVLERWRYGPVFEWREGADAASFLAVRPFYSRVAAGRSGDYAWEVLWPFLVSYQHVGVMRRSTGLLVLWRYDDRDVTDPEVHCYLLPLWFSGREPTGQSYHALFPAGGRICGFLGFDEVRFAAFPLWLHSRKGDAESTHVLFPIYHRLDSARAAKLRVFPFWGYHEQKGIWITNFILWPIIIYGHSLDPARPGSAFSIMPLFGYARSGTAGAPDERCSWTCLWPFISFSRGPEGSRWHAPWPFVRTSENAPATETAWHVWPLAGHQVRPGLDYRYWLWPLIYDVHEERPDQQLDRFYALPLYWQIVSTGKPGVVDDYRRFWPLVSYHRDAAGMTDWRVLALWPQRDTPQVERNWAPFWTLYHSRGDGVVCDRELLWGWWQQHRGTNGSSHGLFPFYSYQTTPAAQRQQLKLLTGLVGHERDDTGRYLRLGWWWRIRTGP